MSISENQRIPLPEAIGSAPFITRAAGPISALSSEPGSYLAFLGRLTAEKGPEPAIRIARAAGMPLQIEPQVDGEQVRLNRGSQRPRQTRVSRWRRCPLVSDRLARTVRLVMIEAMACGTPVIAFRSGSVPEVVDHGITGFVVSDEEEAIQAIGLLLRADIPVRRRIDEGDR